MRAGRASANSRARRTTVSAVIPHTSAVTTLGHKGPGDRVNLEVDVTVKYVERLLTWNTGAAQAAPREDT